MRERTIFKFILNVNATVPFIIGLASVIVGFILFYMVEKETEGTLYVTLGIGFFTWALAIKSETITKKIMGLVTKTKEIIVDIKSLLTRVKNLLKKTNKSISKTNKQIEETKELIKSIGITNVVDGIGEINDRRLILRDKLIKIKLYKQPNRVIIQDYLNQHTFIIWKTLTFINKIFIFKKQLLKPEKRKLIHEIDCLFFDLIEGKIFFRLTILDEYKNQLQQIFNKIKSLDVFKEKPDRVKRMNSNLKFLRDEINYYLNWDNKRVNVKR